MKLEKMLSRTLVSATVLALGAAACGGSSNGTHGATGGSANSASGGAATASSSSSAPTSSTGTGGDSSGAGSGGADAGSDGGPGDGFTTFPGLPGTPNGYAQAIYVDSKGGSDTNTGDSPAQALQHVDPSSKLYTTLAALGDGANVVVLLKPGSDFGTEQFQIPVAGTAAYPLLVSGSMWPGVTGGARPLVQSLQVKYGSGKQSHIAVTGLHLSFPGHTPLEIEIDDGTDYLVEDCLLDNSFQSLNAGTADASHPMTNIRLRRSYFFGANGASGASVGMYVTSVIGMTIEENFFDYNGGDGAYTSSNLYQPTNNELSHDIYVGANSDGMTVTAQSFTVRRNLFARTMQSVKGPYSGTFDDNLFYNYTTANYGSANSYVGPQGVIATNNVMINGPGFGTSVDNGHAGTGPSGPTAFCNNLLYNEGTPFASTAITTLPAAATTTYSNNVIDGFDQGLKLEDTTCGGYTLSNNVIQATYLFWIHPLGCSMKASGGTYWSSSGATGQVAYDNAQSPQYLSFSQLETILGETGGTFASAPIAFTDPSRNIGGYLTKAGLATGSPTLIDYLKLVQAQAAQMHQWSPALEVTAINAYLRDGHAQAGQSLAYSTICP
jgi:hypothetical protein